MRHHAVASIRGARLAFLILCATVGPAGAQSREPLEPTRALTVGIGALVQYPEPFRSECGVAPALVPSATFRQRIGRFFAAEGSLTAQLPVFPEHRSDCGEFLIGAPPGSSVTTHRFDSGSHDASLVPEARLVLSPVIDGAAVLRAFAGAGWYVGRNTPVFAVGAGFRAPARWGGVVIDAERRIARVPYDLVRLTRTDQGIDRVTVGDGRRTFRGWQLRIAFDVWTGSSRPER